MLKISEKKIRERTILKIEDRNGIINGARS